MIPAGSRMAHQAVFYRSHDDLLQAVVPFLEEGMAAGEATVAITTEDVAARLKAALNGERRLAVMDAREVFSRPIDALEAYRAVTEAELEAGARRVRLLGEVAPGTMGSWYRWAWFEAASNRLLAGLPLSALCLYDEQALSPAVLDVGRRAHPAVRAGDGWRDNHDFVPPESMLRPLGRQELEDLPTQTPDLRLVDVTDSTAARRELATVVRRLAGARGDDLVGAVSELLTNARQHGRPPVGLDLWCRDGTLVCVVSDGGPGIDDPLVGFQPPLLPDAGAGLWLARNLVDHLTIGRTGDRFAVLVELRGEV
ncbi:MAG: anti-sigma factor RsbA family regulatory protein [Actinomycetota bacterium]